MPAPFEMRVAAVSHLRQREYTLSRCAGHDAYPPLQGGTEVGSLSGAIRYPARNDSSDPDEELEGCHEPTALRGVGDLALVQRGHCCEPTNAEA